MSDPYDGEDFQVIRAFPEDRGPVTADGGPWVVVNQPGSRPFCSKRIFFELYKANRAAEAYDEIYPTMNLVSHSDYE